MNFLIYEVSIPESTVHKVLKQVHLPAFKTNSDERHEMWYSKLPQMTKFPQHMHDSGEKGSIFKQENFWKNESIYGGCYRKHRVNEGISMRDEEHVGTYGLQRNYFQCSHNTCLNNMTENAGLSKCCWAEGI